MTDQADRKRRADQIRRILAKTYPDARCALDFKTPLQLLVATILAAQCTDARVNIVTKTLFKKYRSAADFATAPLAELERDVQSTGFFRNKAKNIQGCCRLLVEQFDGKVPADMDTLVQLPGVGRKTANVILGTAFEITSGIVVDTHVIRLSHRMGLTEEEDPVRIENDLTELIPRRDWIAFGHHLTHHGRQICVARKPKCDACPVNRVCPRIGVDSSIGVE